MTETTATAPPVQARAAGSREEGAEAAALLGRAPCSQLAAVLEVELGEHASDVGLDGLRADAEPDGDLDVRPAPAQLLEHSLLGGGEGAWVGRASTASSRHGATLAADPPNYITRSALRPEQRLQLAIHAKRGRPLRGALRCGVTGWGGASRVLINA